MKLRHAAALALVGWYLMMPVINPKTDKAQLWPLRDWDHEGSYDTAREESKQELIKEFQKAGAPEHDLDIYLFNGQCIASDDPRLKDR